MTTPPPAVTALLVALPAALLLVACSGSGQPARSQAGTAAEAVFVIRTTTCGSENQQRAVAAAVGAELLATVGHVFTGSGAMEVEGPDGRRRGATVVALDTERDLALVELDEPSARWLELGTAEDGDPVTIVTLVDDEPATRPGRIVRHVTATLDGEGARSAIELEADIDRGQSGSPVLGPDGRMVGLVFAAVRGDRRGWALDAEEVETALSAVGAADPVDLAC